MFGHSRDMFLTGEIPEVRWMQSDDLCDCTFQRIGEWTNPYIGRTMRIRFCCVWDKFAEQYPQFFEFIPAFYNYNEDKFEDEPWEWDSPDIAMPRDIWYRQIQKITGKPLEQIRMEYRDKEPPGPKPTALQLQGALLKAIATGQVKPEQLVIEGDNIRVVPLGE